MNAQDFKGFFDGCYTYNSVDRKGEICVLGFCSERPPAWQFLAQSVGNRRRLWAVGGVLLIDDLGTLTVEGRALLEQLLPDVVRTVVSILAPSRGTGVDGERTEP